MARVLASAALVAAASGCAAFEPVPGFSVSPGLWHTRVARQGVDPAVVPNPMALTPEMEVVARRLAGAGSADERLERLRRALLEGREFAFEYERGATFSAAEAFTARRGNCVSFTNLFIALGRSLGIRLQGALVVSRGASEKQGELIVTYNHMVAIHPIGGGGSARVYDFYRLVDEPAGGLVVLEDLAVAAIRASNLGVARLEAGDAPGAVREMEIAVKLEPHLGSLYANLGLAQWRAGDVAGAFETFRLGLERDHASPALHQNLAALYVEQGLPAEARAALGALDTSRASPYALIVQGDLRLMGGDVPLALASYRRASRIDPKLAAPWVAIARAELARGRRDAARKAAEKALAKEPGNEDAAALAQAAR